MFKLHSYPEQQIHVLCDSELEVLFNYNVILELYTTKNNAVTLQYQTPRATYYIDITFNHTVQLRPSQIVLFLPLFKEITLLGINVI